MSRIWRRDQVASNSPGGSRVGFGPKVSDSCV